MRGMGPKADNIYTIGARSLQSVIIKKFLRIGYVQEVILLTSISKPVRLSSSSTFIWIVLWPEVEALLKILIRHCNQ